MKEACVTNMRLSWAQLENSTSDIQKQSQLFSGLTDFDLIENVRN